MTRKVGAGQPPITTKHHNQAAHLQDVNLSLAEENVTDISDNEDEPGYNMINYTDVPMHHFGVPSQDPANYRNTVPLRDDLHFTDAPSASSVGFATAELNAFLRDEFAQSNILHRLSDSYVQTPDYAGFAETSSQCYDDLVETMSHWPQQSCTSPGQTFQYMSRPFPFNPPQTFGQPPQIATRTATSSVAPTGLALRPIKPRVGPARPNLRAPPDSIDADGKEHIKGRKRPLSPNSRATALRVRIIGACARCHEKHEQCSEERPCKPCSSTAKRSLDFFCMQELPKDRHVHVFTDDLYGHLNIKEGRLALPVAKLSPANEPFRLRLVQYFDTPELWIPVVMFQPESMQDLRKLIFPVARDGDKFEVTPEEILSPPLVPFLEKEDLAAYAEKFKMLVYQWLDQADKNNQIGWHKEFFREEEGNPWPRDVLEMICQFYHQVMRGGCQPLRTALQSTILVFMLGHSFYVPPEDVEDVLEKTGLSQYYRGQFIFVAPHYVNRFIKVLLYQFLKATVRLALKYYQDLCSPHKHTKLDRDRILGVSIILLIVAGSIQSKAMYKAETSRRNGTVDNSKYYERIEEIEKWIVDLVCEIWTYKFGRAGKIKPDDDPNERLMVWEAKRFNLMERFRHSYEKHANDLDDLSTDLPSEEELQRSWKTPTNVDRVLKNFYRCVYETSSETKSQGRVKRESNSSGVERNTKARR